MCKHHSDCMAIPYASLLLNAQVNPNNGHAMAGPVGPLVTARNSVLHDPQHVSTLHLPLIALSALEEMRL